MIATMSTVWDRTAEFLSDNFAALAPIVLLAIFVPLSLFGNLMPLRTTTGQTGAIVIGAVLVLLSLVQIWGSIAITALAFDPAGGRGPAMDAANRRLVPMVGIYLLMLLMIFAATIPVGIALGAGGLNPAAIGSGHMSMQGLDGGTVAFAFCYSLLLIGVFLWVYTRCFTLIIPIVVMERRGLTVFARSFVLTRTIAWKVFGMLLLYVIVSQVCALAAQTVFGSVLRLLFGDEGPMSLANILTSIVVSGISTVFAVLAVAFTAKLYLAARDAREAIVEAA